MSTEPPISDLSHLSEEEFISLCPQGEHAPGPEPLSPAAQAVKDAALAEYADCNVRRLAWPLDMPIAAATLRAAADQTRPEIHIEDIDHVHQNYVDGWKDALYMIIDIATELEAQS